MTRSAGFPLQQMVPGRVARLCERLEARLWEPSRSLNVEVGPVHATPVPIAGVAEERLRPCRPGERFARADDLWGQCWFRVEVPEADQGASGRRFLRWSGRGELTVYLDEVPWAGLDVAHRECPLPDRAVTLWLDCGVYQTAIWCPGPTPDQFGYRFEGAWLVHRDQLAWETFYRWDSLRQLMDRLLADDGFLGARASHRYKTPIAAVSPLLRQLLGALDRACDAFDRGGLAPLSGALDTLEARFPAEAWQPAAAVVGHAHLDLVWLWPWRVTRRKAIHTFATVLRLMERDDGFTFVHSSPSLYEHIEAEAPGLYAQIEARISEGRWEATGGFEVEVDTYLPTGEALARALAYGQRRFQRLRGGARCRVAWLPDVFGYSSCLPQVLVLGGCDRFFTTKLSWSPITRFPHHSFRWLGPGGAQVLTHLCPTGYNRHLELEDLVGCAREYRQGDVHDEQLLPQGYGDGGGGPTEAMLERARALADLAGCPRARWSGVEAFFDRLEACRDDLPTYEGELYLETHRGTLTSQGRLKAAYRAAERALQTHEAARVAQAGEPLGFEGWRRLLFAQFHDALPGSSIGEVYDELTPELEGLSAEHLGAAADELGGRGESLGLFNPLPFARPCLVELDAEALRGRPSADGVCRIGGALAPAQLIAGGQRLLVAPEIGGLAVAALTFAEEPRSAPAPTCSGSPTHLESDRVRLEVSDQGELLSLSIDGSPLPVSRAGLVLYEDHPVSFDAWDIDRHSLDLGQAVGREMALTMIEEGPVRATLEGRASIGAASELTLRYQLWAGLPYLLIEALVSWNEDHRLLRYEVSTGSRAALARFGEPFGSVERRQLPGREADEVQWEVAGSRWAAVGEADQRSGLALITEAKYGFSCREGRLGVSLLRSPTDPDPRCDRGEHRLRWALGRYRATTAAGELATAAAAEALFTPPLLVTGATSSSPPFELSRPGSLVPCWVTPAETCPGFVLRCHEVAGRSGVAWLDLPAEPGSVRRVNFLEDDLGALEQEGAGGRFRLDYSPHQILSVLVRAD